MIMVPASSSSARREDDKDGLLATIRTGRFMDRFIHSDQNQSASVTGASRPELVVSELPTVDFFPAEIVRHRTAHWRGVQANTVQIVSHEPFEYSFKQEYHLLIAVEQGVRYDGETFVEGLPTSTMRNYSNKLIFVPAGRRFFGAQNPRLLTRSICLYIDPRMVAVDPDLRFDEAQLKPGLLFENDALWQTVLKLKEQIGSGDPADRMYADALGGLLAHELLRLYGTIPSRPPSGGVRRSQDPSEARNHKAPRAILVSVGRLETTEEVLQHVRL